MALETIGLDSAASEGTLLTSDTSANSYGSYTELVASTGQACERIAISARHIIAGSTRSSVITLATGAASSEVDFLSFVIPHGAGEGMVQVAFEIPFTISSGTRISAKVKSSSANSTLEVMAILSDDDSFGTGSAAELIGEANSKGTVVDPGGTAHTKGSWAELAASTSHDYDLLILFIGWNQNNLATAASWLIDIGTGSAASETVLVADIMHSLSLFEVPNLVFPIYAPIASGTRVAVRAQCSITDATDRLFDAAILGVNLTAPSGGGGGGGGRRPTINVLN